MRYWVHALCVIGGIAAAAGSTMATTRPGGARSQQHYAQVEALAEGQTKTPGPSGAASAPQAPIPAANAPQTEADRKAASPGDTSPRAIVNAFDQMAFFDGNPIAAMKRYLAEDFVERYPDMAVGGFANDKAAMIHFFETRGWKKGEHNTDTVYQVLADGERVAVFHRVTTSPADRGTAFVDIFRVRGGKIVEHWAVGQPISAKVSPRHSMF
jgi:predicted SnoaL-like aldol condensation-catalyzing enzyme